jgi:hypothetical protein
MLRQLPSALGVADRSYRLIQKNAAHPCHSQSHSTQIHATTRRLPCAPATRQPHQDSDALASARAHHPAARRASARPLAAPWPPSQLLCCSLCHPSHRALAAARRHRAPEFDALAGACPLAFTSATARPSSDILDTKRAPTPTPRLVTRLLRAATLTPQLAPILLHALTLSAARPPRSDADQPVSSISHC